MRLKRDYNCSRKGEFKKIHRDLKMTRCPYCRCTGYLILHGYLYGYAPERGCRRMTRGRRILCSNRNRRRGCGHTLSVFITAAIKRFSITTQALFEFMNNIDQGMNKAQASRQAALPFCASSIYRLYKRFSRRQSFIREQLIKQGPPPVSKSSNPLDQTLAHIKSVFPGRSDPLCAFQEHFQTPLL